jgi:uncharacterized Fe-S cluster protein YjdI
LRIIRWNKIQILLFINITILIKNGEKMKDVIKKYSNGEVTIIWQPAKCIHSTICFNGLPEVFDPNKRPWVAIDGASTDKIIAQVKECPSGALAFQMNDK